MLCDANANEIVASGTHRQQAVQTQRQRHALQAPKWKSSSKAFSRAVVQTVKRLQSGFPLPSADKFPCGPTDQFKTSNATAYELTESHTPSALTAIPSELEPLSARVKSIVVEPSHDGVEPLRLTRVATLGPLWRRVTLWPLEHLSWPDLDDGALADVSVGGNKHVVRSGFFVHPALKLRPC